MTPRSHLPRHTLADSTKRIVDGRPVMDESAMRRSREAKEGRRPRLCAAWRRNGCVFGSDRVLTAKSGSGHIQFWKFQVSVTWVKS